MRPASGKVKLVHLPIPDEPGCPPGMPAAVSSPTMLTAFDDARLFGAAHGTGSPWVLALHGWARTHSDFDQVFADGLDGIALDLPGFGATPPPESAWGSADYAAAVVPVLHEMGGPVVVVGHSFGGRVAVHLASASPEHVRALVLTSVPLFRATGSRPRPPLRFRTARRLARAGLISEERMERARRRYGSADYRAAEGVMRDVLVRLLHEEYLTALEATSCPVELVWGEDDREVPVSVAERIREAVPDARLTVLPGAGHLTVLTAPGGVRAAIERHHP